MLWLPPSTHVGSTEAVGDHPLIRHVPYKTAQYRTAGRVFNADTAAAAAPVNHATGLSVNFMVAAGQPSQLSGTLAAYSGHTMALVHKAKIHSDKAANRREISTHNFGFHFAIVDTTIVRPDKAANVSSANDFSFNFAIADSAAIVACQASYIRARSRCVRCLNAGIFQRDITQPAFVPHHAE